MPWYLVDDEIHFPLNKHSLIALSQTCWSVRVPTERQLYRDLYMNLGPMYDTIRRQADRILNTLQRRPELGTYVKNFAMRWNPGYSLSSTVDNIISRFLTLFPRLQFLFLTESHYPQLLNSFSGCNITFFGTHFTDKESLCNILTKFPKLTYLYLCAARATSLEHNSVNRTEIKSHKTILTRSKQKRASKLHIHQSGIEVFSQIEIFLLSHL